MRSRRIQGWRLTTLALLPAPRYFDREEQVDQSDDDAKYGPQRNTKRNKLKQQVQQQYGRNGDALQTKGFKSKLTRLSVRAKSKPISAYDQDLDRSQRE